MREPTPEELAELRARFAERPFSHRVVVLPKTRDRARWHDWLDTALIAAIFAVDVALWLSRL